MKKKLWGIEWPWPFFSVCCWKRCSKLRGSENRKESDIWFAEIKASVFSQDWGQSTGTTLHWSQFQSYTVCAQWVYKKAAWCLWWWWCINIVQIDATLSMWRRLYVHCTVWDLRGKRVLIILYIEIILLHFSGYQFPSLLKYPPWASVLFEASNIMNYMILTWNKHLTRCIEQYALEKRSVCALACPCV